jgi:hypothetical protein
MYHTTGGTSGESGRATDQFDLYKNGEFVTTGGRKKCLVAMLPVYIREMSGREF